MITSAEFLLLLILSAITTYTFMSWNNINDKGSKVWIFFQFILWTAFFGAMIIITKKLGLVT